MTGEEAVVEWAVQYRTYIGGRFERTVPYDNEGAARKQVESFNKGKPANQHARVATRTATKWKSA